ncbi:twin-arginine translocation signal domain-containing protein [Gammaproteobacteria bacterium]|nr:twin-arginine translocation signal domain-containing protein [Gammaproteobacteria bacterium]
MKKFIREVSGLGFKLGIKGLKATVKAAAKAGPPMIFGAAEFTKDTSSEAYYVFAGRKKKERLVAKLNRQNSKHKLKKLDFNNDNPFVDACVLSGLTASEMMMRGVPSDVQEAFEKAYPQLSAETSFLESWEGMSDYEARLGFVSGIKGKLFEVKYVDHLNETLEPGYLASMALDPTQKGWDIKIEGPNQEVQELLQLKATTSTSYIKDAIEQYPEIDVITLSDLQGQLGSISSITNVSASNISSAELIQEIDAATDDSSFFFPAVPLLALGYIVFSNYKEQDISHFKKHQRFGKRASNLVLNTSIISAAATPFIGIPLVLGKEYLFRGARRDKEIIHFLKSQIKQSRNTQKVWEKQTSRRSFLKGLGVASATLVRTPKIVR